jgi:hypothetical protein
LGTLLLIQRVLALLGQLVDQLLSNLILELFLELLFHLIPNSLDCVLLHHLHLSGGLDLLAANDRHLIASADGLLQVYILQLLIQIVKHLDYGTLALILFMHEL